MRWWVTWWASGEGKISKSFIKKSLKSSEFEGIFCAQKFYFLKKCIKVSNFAIKGRRWEMSTKTIFFTDDPKFFIFPHSKFYQKRSHVENTTDNWMRRTWKGKVGMIDFAIPLAWCCCRELIDERYEGEFREKFSFLLAEYSDYEFQSILSYAMMIIILNKVFLQIGKNHFQNK